MKILVACEESQIVCKAFRDRCHEAYSCDIIECSGGHPEWHLQMDALTALQQANWDMLIGHPPCTFMSAAGARWMYPKGILNKSRLEKALQAKAFFLELLNSKIDKIAIENPKPLSIVGLPNASQFIQPFQFGHPFSKGTYLWLKNLPNLVPTQIITKYTPYLPSNTGAKKTWW